MSLSHVKYLKDFSSIRFPQPAMAVCDARLPRHILKNFPNRIEVRAGEDLKSLRKIETLAEKVLKKTADRNLTLLAVGGGSVGDAAGFLASILWRGVNFIQVPTTLLAMADSAHGGKTAANLAKAKNQLGTFYPASEVWIVRSVLDQMSPSLIEDGLLEVIKASLLGDQKLAQNFFAKGALGVNLFPALKRAIAVKNRIVESDPEERKGKRRVLNLGHTLGHAIEANTNLSHGASINWGLLAMAELSSERGFKFKEEVYELLTPLLKKPKRWPSSMALKKSLSKDKKIESAKLHSILLSDLGRPKIVTDLSSQDWIESLKKVRKRVGS